MPLAIFDLDNTLLAGDSDHLWGEFVCEQNLVETEGYAQRNEQFYRDYGEGNLDIFAYLRFALSPLAGQPHAVLQDWSDRFMRSKIDPIVLPQGRELIERHREQGHEILIITATNHFITRPIADALGVEHLLACEAEIVDGLYTGEPSGVPSFAEGKVTRLRDWLAQREQAIEDHLSDAWFYSDSHNDLPLMKLVGNPVAVDPDDRLLSYAKAQHWRVLSLRD